MNDDAARALERRFRASGASEDWAAWAHARQRAGELGPEATPWIERIASDELTRAQVTLAGYLGDPLALSLDEFEVVRIASYLSEEHEIVSVVLGDAEGGDVRAWVRGLAHWDPAWCARAMLAEAEALRSELEDPDLDAWELEALRAQLSRAIESTRACLDDPGDLEAREQAAEEGAEFGYASVRSVEAARLAAACAAKVTGGLDPEVHLLDETPAAVERIRAALLPRVLGGWDPRA